MNVIKNQNLYTVESNHGAINFDAFEVDKFGQVLMYRKGHYIGLMRRKHAKKFNKAIAA